MDTYTILVISHLVGTILGVGGATFVEIFLNKALRDGEVDPIESSFLKTTFTVVRVGLVISLISGFGFLLLYKFTGQVERLYNPLLWAKLTMILIIAFNAILLQAHKISLWWGSTLSFTSWYSAAIVGTMLNGPSYPYFLIMLYYTIAVIIIGIILGIIRESLKIKT